MDSTVLVSIVIAGGAVLAIATWQLLEIGEQAMTLDKRRNVSSDDAREE